MKRIRNFSSNVCAFVYNRQSCFFGSLHRKMKFWIDPFLSFHFFFKFRVVDWFPRFIEKTTKSQQYDKVFILHSGWKHDSSEFQNFGDATLSTILSSQENRPMTHYCYTNSNMQLIDITVLFRHFYVSISYIIIIIIHSF